MLTLEGKTSNLEALYEEEDYSPSYESALQDNAAEAHDRRWCIATSTSLCGYDRQPHSPSSISSNKFFAAAILAPGWDKKNLLDLLAERMVSRASAKRSRTDKLSEATSSSGTSQANLPKEEGGYREQIFKLADWLRIHLSRRRSMQLPYRLSPRPATRLS